MFSVVDMYDTLTSAQPDQPAWTPEAASEELRVQGGRQFDPQVVQAFLTLPFLGSARSNPPVTLRPRPGRAGVIMGIR
ncbi:hypothetical protein ACFSC4_25475 [Deinococcus malanensis]|uniref:hypothetical protein n=1 Tax=Deinococcus malanensis TaxID=1706855 RepID=UPI00362B37C6